MNVREAADGKLSTAGVGFFKREGINYRKWIPPGQGDEAAIEQLVLPTQCRQTVLELTHDVSIAGHLGKEKTRQRVLHRFYLPTVFRDILPKLCDLPEGNSLWGKSSPSNSITSNLSTLFWDSYGYCRATSQKPNRKQIHTGVL